MDYNINNSGGVIIKSVHYDFMWVVKSNGIKDQMINDVGIRKSYKLHLNNDKIDYAVWNPMFGRGIVFGVYRQNNRLVFLCGDRIFAPICSFYTYGKNFTSKLFTRNIIEVTADQIKNTGKIQYCAYIVFKGQFKAIHELGIIWNGLNIINYGFEGIIDLGQVKIEI
jgi:hypothetical protein